MSGSSHLLEDRNPPLVIIWEYKSVTSVTLVMIGLSHGGWGALGYFLGGYVPPGTPNWHPVLEIGQFFIPRSRIRPKTDTPF